MTHLRCGGIFSDSIMTLYKYSPDSDSEINSKIGHYLMKLKAYEVKAYKKVPFFEPSCIYL